MGGARERRRGRGAAQIGEWFPTGTNQASALVTMRANLRHTSGEGPDPTAHKDIWEAPPGQKVGVPGCAG